jgi:hypothetical protein
MNNGEKPINTFYSSWFPYVFSLLLLGTLSAFALSEAFSREYSQYKFYGAYLSIFFVGFFIIIAILFINGFYELMIYRDRIVLKTVITSITDTIYFKDVERSTFQHKKRSTEQSWGNWYLLLVGESNTYNLKLYTKDKQELIIPLSNFLNLKDILNSLKKTDLVDAKTD